MCTVPVMCQNTLGIRIVVWVVQIRETGYTIFLIHKDVDGCLCPALPGSRNRDKEGGDQADAVMGVWSGKGNIRGVCSLMP